MGDDFAAIEAWAQIFTEPAELAETVAKRWVLHRKTIKKDIANEEADWSAGNYFQAGIDTAMALTEAVGPIQSTPVSYENEFVGMPIFAAPKFVAGFLYGMTGDNNLTEVEACYTGGEALGKELEIAIGDLEKKDLTDAMAAIGQVVD